MLECVVNVSEGRHRPTIDALCAAAGDHLLDVHSDPHHNRSVLTLAGQDAPRLVAAEAVARIDLRAHAGAHPRIGAVDVVPFVPLGADHTLDRALAARDAFADWAAAALGVPCFLYGPERSLPEIRRLAFRELTPDTGPREPHPTAGACAVGARGVLVAYNVWLDGADLAEARRLARGLRGPHVRALGFAAGDTVQVSMNLLDPAVVGPASVYDTIAAEARVARAELVGLIPAATLHATPRHRWGELDLAETRTIESRLEARGLAAG